MAASSTKQGTQCKPSRQVIRSLSVSRNRFKKKCQTLKQKLCQAERLLAQQERELAQQREELGELQQQVRRLETEQRIAQSQAPIRLPDDPSLPGHGYGAGLIALAVNLAQAVGLRGSVRVLEIVFAWLGVQQKVPHYTAVRTWLQRLGLAALSEPLEPADDWVWMADHSNQIGPEKVLLILGVQASQLPPPGEPLRHEHVRILELQPGVSWKRADMAARYTELAQQHGNPRAVLSDEARELQEGAACLESLRTDVLVLQDFKHKAANVLKSLLEKEQRFVLFSSLLGKTRSAIQQTELAHLTPPSSKPKARFMNLGALLDWAAMVLWVLDHPEAKARQGVSAERLEEKLGWLRLFADALAVWRECQQIIDLGLKFINEQGLFRGGASQWRSQFPRRWQHAASRTLAARLLAFLRAAERRLKPSERLPLSTEILESCFALYKQLERQHSKGGFTSLLAAFGALLTKATPEAVKAAFAKVSVKDVRQWVRERLGATLTSKRAAAYQEFRKADRAVPKLAPAS